jgi:hypothetical protein
VVRDEDGICRLTVPPGYTVDSAGDGFDADDGKGIGVLTGATGRAETPEALAQSLYGGFTSILTDLQQGQVTNTADTSQIDFTGTLGTQPGKGTVYVKKFGTTVCGLSVFTYSGAAVPHESAITSLIPTVRENR